MALEGFNRVGVIEYGSSKYHFAIYDDGYNYEVGDWVVTSGRSDPAQLIEIITVEEASERFRKNITAEIIGKFDRSAYEERLKKREEKEKLREEMKKRRKAIQQILDDEYFAERDPEYAAMLKKFNEL